MRLLDSMFASVWCVWCEGWMEDMSLSSFEVVAWRITMVTAPCELESVVVYGFVFPSVHVDL